MGRLMLDLCSGLGGANVAFRERGWQVVTIDNDPLHAPDICTDLRTFSWDGPRPDLLWASPPCDEFSRESMPWCRTGIPPDLSLVQAVFRLVEEIRPRFWILENVRGAKRFLGPPYLRFGAVYLWGQFPLVLCNPLWWKEKLPSSAHQARAKIPYDLSHALAAVIDRACAETRKA